MAEQSEREPEEPGAVPTGNGPGARGHVWHAALVSVISVILLYLLFAPGASVTEHHEGPVNDRVVLVLGAGVVLFTINLLLAVSCRALVSRGMAVIALLACVFFLFSVVQARVNVIKAAERHDCSRNMHALGVALAIYILDYGGRFPPADRWADALHDQYVGTPTYFRCPADRSRGRSSYAMNANLSGKPKAEVEAPANTVLLYETAQSRADPSGTGEDLPRSGRHDRSLSNFLFVDGSLRPRTVRRAKVRAGSGEPSPVF